MRKNVFSNRFAFLMILILGFMQANAQTTITTGSTSPYTGANSGGVGGAITFVIENTNTYGILISDMGQFLNAADNNAVFELWYSPTSLGGAPPSNAIASPAFTLIATSPSIPNSTTGISTIFTNLNFLIPAGIQYRFALKAITTTCRYSGSGTAGISPNTFSAGGVNLKLGDVVVPGGNVGYAVSPTATNTPRSYTGEFTFIQESACTTPPVPGMATTSASTVCYAQSASLNLTGNSFGLTQTYQWQSSTTQNGTYTNFGSASTVSSLTINPIETLWYRAFVSCNGQNGTSDPIKVVVNPIIPGGNYTINAAAPAGGGNYTSFGDAVNAIKCGISGPVVFRVAAGSGPYNEQVTIPQIPGASSTNTISFKGSLAKLEYGSTNNNLRAILTLDGADHIKIDSLIIDGTGGTYGWGVFMTNRADSNKISNCTINVSNTSITSVNHAPIVISGSFTSTTASGNNGNHDTIWNNTLNGGYYGVTIMGNSAAGSQNMKNVIGKNKIMDTYGYGIYAAYQSGALISGNDISRPSRITSNITAGIYSFTGNLDLLIEKNRVHNMFDAMPTNASTCYGIYISSAGTAALPNKIINNMVYNVGGDGLLYGIYNATSPNMIAYHNTISLDGQAAATGACYGFYQTGAATGIDFRNNLVSITRSGTGTKRCIHLNTTTSTVVSNRNVLYMNAPAGTSNFVGQYGTTGTFTFATLADWQTANTNAYDQQSMSTAPRFLNVASGNYTPTASLIDNLGTPVGITSDILDSARSTTSPDAGAYEFCTLTPGLNMSAQGLVTPLVSTSGCYSNAETVTIRFRNFSSATHDFATNPVTVITNVTGAVTQTLSATINTGTLASDATMDIPMSATLNMGIPGVYNFNANTSLTGDVNTANDAMIPVSRTKNILTSGSATAGPESYCVPTPVNPMLSITGGSGYNTLQWRESVSINGVYNNIAGAITNPFTITSPITQTMYYKMVATCGSLVDSSSPVTVTYYNPQVTSTTPGSRCGTGTVSLGAVASPGASLSWYEAATGGNSVGSGTTFTTPAISTNTTYYVAANNGGSSGSTGLANAISTTGYTLEAGLFFNALSTFNINGVNVYPMGTGAGTVTIALQNSAGTTLQSTVANLTGTASPYVKTYVPLNFTVPLGTDYRLVMLTRTGLVTGLIREGGSTWGSYPLTWPGVVSIVNGKCCPDAIQASYYYFYDWQVSTGCEGARTSVLARTDDCTVPVTLLSFTGEKQGSFNKLSWTTSTEINNAGFGLERSADGRNFSKLAFVASLGDYGNSNRNLDYVYNDKSPLAGNGYYRLKQVDKDGKFTFSNTVLVKGSKVTDVSITSLYPNPATNEINLVITSPASEKVNVVITDITGKVINQTAMQVITGDNLKKLEIGQLASGTYLIKTICASGCQSAVQKFVKQ